MDTVEWAVLGGAAAAIAAVNLYFLGPRRGARRAPARPGPGGEATVVVRGGYTPAEVRVPAGAPIRLEFDRREDTPCSDEVVFPSAGVSRFLEPHARTVVELPALPPGTHEFTCGMGMLRGRLVVELADGSHAAAHASTPHEDRVRGDRAGAGGCCHGD